MQTLKTSMHSAAYCSMTGVGMLVMPPVEDCGIALGLSSLHEVDYSDMLKLLEAHDVELLDDEDGEPWPVVGYTDRGGLAVALAHRHPISEHLSPQEYAEAVAIQASLLGVTVSVASAS